MNGKWMEYMSETFCPSPEIDTYQTLFFTLSNSSGNGGIVNGLFPFQVRKRISQVEKRDIITVKGRKK